jgi:hypothetical protein
MYFEGECNAIWSAICKQMLGILCEFVALVFIYCVYNLLQS